MSQAVTIEIPERLFEQLKRTAELSNRPIEAVIEHSLTHSLPPLLQDIPTEYQTDVYPLLEMDVAALQQEVRRVFPAEQWAEYEALLQKKQERTLSSEEVAQLDGLRQEADILSFRKAYAAVLLKRRGYVVPAVDNLPAVR